MQIVQAYKCPSCSKSFEIGIEEIIAKYKFYEELAIADRSNLECNILE